MTKPLPHIIPNIEKWPINLQYQDRSAFIRKLNEYSRNQILENADVGLDKILTNTVYSEKNRVRHRPWKVDPPDDKKYWDEIGAEVNEAAGDTEKLDEILKRVINRYNEEIMGGFEAKTFKFARKLLTAVFKGIFNKFFTKATWRPWGTKEILTEKFHVHGDLEHIRSLVNKGVVVVVPTHFSNLDSPLVGYILDLILGIPAFGYGAGLNLYEFELAAHYMNKLGAYRVDRRKKNPIYLQCLKGMTCLSIYDGVHNIFFPGGTRARDGALESKLKLGLLNATIEAQRMLITDKKDRKIFVIPMILDYHVVLEAKSLIDQNLKQKGGADYIRTKRKRSKFFQTISFIKNIFSKESEMVISFGPAMDVLGNQVDKEGNSIDKHGSITKLESYFSNELKEVTKNKQTEWIYTKELAQKIVDSYYKDNVVLSSHLLAFVAFKLYQTKFPDLDIYSFLNQPSKVFKISEPVFNSNLSACLNVLKSMHNRGEIKLSEPLTGDLKALTNHGFKNIGVYHGYKPLYIKNKYICTKDIKLLYYYHNKLSGYRLDTMVKWQL